METKNEPIPNEIVAATAAEPEYQVLGVDLTRPENADTPINWSKFATTSINKVVACQQCMCCENTRELYDGWYSPGPWICEDCKEAIAYAKEILRYRGDRIFYD